LRVRPSTIPNAGKGLFAEDPLRADREIIFRVGDYIIDYTGESINENQLEERYGEYTGPYAIEVRGRSNQRGGLFIDAAAERGVGSLINHRARSSANSVFVVDYRANRARLRAVRPIRNGDEIFVSYGNQYQMNEPGASSRTKGLR
jgi:SET domain-containing protein